jgi:hypothetical protein
MKKKSFFYNITYYNVIPITILAICFMVFRNHIIQLLCNLTEVTEPSGMYTLYQYAVTIALPVIWIYITLTHIIEKRYHKLTGRSYRKDHIEFRKSYKELVDFYTKNNPYKLDVDDLTVEDWHNADGVILGKYKDQHGNYRLIKRDSDANGNLVAFGLPGCGKSTTQAATTAERFNANLKNGGCGVFAISIKGDLLNFVKGKRTNIKVFTPDCAAGSCHYDPLHGVTEMSWTDRKVFAENLAINVCPDEQGDNSAYFVGGARDYLAAIILYLLYLHDSGKRKGNLKFPEIVDMILQSSVFELTMQIHDSESKIAGEYTNGYIGSSEKNVSGIWSHLCKRIRTLNAGALPILLDGEGDCITPEDLEVGDIYIDVPQDKYDVYAPCMAIIITNFLQAFMRRNDVSSGKKIIPILFLLDEAVQLNLDYSMLSKAMSTLRSKKVSLFLLMQSVAQLEGRYGESHAREIIDLCAYISVFNAQDPKSREYFQKLVGRQKMLKRTTSISSTGSTESNSSGTNVTETDEYIFEAADFGDLNLKDKKSRKITHRVLIYDNGKYIIAETTPCYQ